MWVDNANYSSVVMSEVIFSEKIYFFMWQPAMSHAT